jgi:hypothetical protein
MSNQQSEFSEDHVRKTSVTNNRTMGETNTRMLLYSTKV